jgi:hypothetical protein
MNTATREWCGGLAAFAAERRSAQPSRPPDPPSVAAAERAILAAHLVAWLEDWTAVMSGRAAWARGSPGANPDAGVVLTTSPVGIAAAEELLAGGHPVAAAEVRRIVPVTELEYRLWCIRHPDDDHRHHINHWSWIKTRVPPQRHGEFTRHPLGPGEAYWLHRAGTAGAGAADRRDCHLWRWNGRHAALLEAFVREGGVSHLGRPTGPDDEA